MMDTYVYSGVVLEVGPPTWIDKHVRARVGDDRFLQTTIAYQDAQGTQHWVAVRGTLPDLIVGRQVRIEKQDRRLSPTEFLVTHRVLVDGELLSEEVTHEDFSLEPPRFPFRR